jgi:hypothetical protein
LVGLAVVATLGAVAAGCFGGGSPHGALSGRDALAQAREDGFVRLTRQEHPGAWVCDSKRATQGIVGAAHYLTPRYMITFEDKRVPRESDNTGRILMGVIVFPNAAMAERCAKGAFYEGTHIPRDGYDPEGDGPYRRVTVIDPTTVQVSRRPAGAPVAEFPQDDGDYETWLAHGRVFGLGMARNKVDARIVRADLERLAAEIDG